MKLSSFLIPGVLITMAVAVWSCSKSNSGSKPSIKVKSINNPIGSGEDFNAVVSFTNGGNLSGGQLIVIRTRLNQRPPDATPGGDTIRVTLPEYTNQDKGDIQFTQPYHGYLDFDDHDNDTLVFKFAVIDADNKSSDTIPSSKIIVLYQ